ncbi:calcium/sodium antiporter [Gordonia hankookensis]|uniref:Calcium/sodium antiporter n=1 Tax=Gordonia hankookensis TaxID=589403 RepID=A0ABR7WBL7_9ACTN|nr:calcium/sodium antiporter [Gordonia hankookensis]MBD1320214.1 calcium/sodium antiporter [Gordonia hankookensis]
MNSYVLVVVGLAALIVGAEGLVRGGSAIAARLGISPMLVGVTVVSIGTSLPELAVGIDAAVHDAGPLAVGNIAGTNIVNILLILGLSAAMVPLTLRRQTIRLDLPVMVVSALLLWALAANGSMSRLDGTILLVLAIAYTITVVRAEISGDDAPLPEVLDTAPAPDRTGWRIVQLVGGMAVVIVGAEWLVTGAVDVAGDLGVSEAVIGLTVVAIGTSAPELATTIMSTIRGERDLAIGNLIGSSIYNVTFILGATSLFRPLEVTDELIRIDLPLMAAVALICVPVFLTGRRITRLEGVAFVVGYVVYLVLVIALRT